MLGEHTQVIGRFEVVRVIGERGPFRDQLCQDADGGNWVVTTWPERSAVVPMAAVAAALSATAGLGEAIPDARIEPILDAHGDVVGLARPRAAGWSVAAWVAQEGPLPPADCMWLAIALVEALGALRGARPGVLHGGISPPEVFVQDDPRAVVICGFAEPRRAVSRALAPAHEGDPPWVESVDDAYAPPEMRIGNHTGPATDLYGVAAVALHALTGGGPRAFSGRMTELESVLVSGHRAPRRLARFLAGALSPTIEVRFQTTEAALDVLTGRAEAQAADPGPPPLPPGTRFSAVPAKASAHVLRAGALGAALSLPYVVLGLSAIAGFGPFPQDLPAHWGVLVAAFAAVGVAANLGLLVRRARAEAGLGIALEEFVLRLDGPDLRAESKWTALRDARLGSGGVEVVGAWSNGSGGWHAADLVVLPDLFEIPPARLLTVIRDTHDRRSPQGWLRSPDAPRRAGRPWWLGVPAVLVLLGWILGTGARVVGGPIEAAPATPPDRLVSAEAVRAEPWRAFPIAERDPDAARKARADLARAVDALAADPVGGDPSALLPTADPAAGADCPDGMQAFALVDGGALPAACVDGAGVMVRAARATPQGPAWFLVGWTETPARAYIACAVGENCPPPVDDPGCHTDLARHADRPANCVTAQGAADYCATVGRRLCTADEWYAAAGAATPVDREGFPAGTPDCLTAVIRDARGPGCGLEAAGITAARPRGASRFGAVDMVGNVAELVAEGGGAALGGGWRSAPGTSGGLRSLAFTPGKPVADVGFRCCRDLPAATAVPSTAP